jgi:hypothetical protein
MRYKESVMQDLENCEQLVSTIKNGIINSIYSPQQIIELAERLEKIQAKMHSTLDLE